MRMDAETEVRAGVAHPALQRGADIRHVQQFLGHADLDTTAIYLRLVPGALREAYDQAMPDLLSSPDPPPAGSPSAAAG
jgi:integrase/recombinase XerD